MNYSPSGRVGLSGPERAKSVNASHELQMQRNSPSPAASASDPPEGRVMRLISNPRLKAGISVREGDPDEVESTLEEIRQRLAEEVSR